MENNQTGVNENSSLVLNAPENNGKKTTSGYQYHSIDSMIAVILYLLSYRYLKHFSNIMTYGFGVTLFVLFYIGAVLLYLKQKKHTPSKESYFWLGVLGLMGISYSLNVNTVFFGFHALFLHCVAVYWTLSASGALLFQKSSAAFFIDGLRGFCFYPFAHFGAWFLSVASGIGKIVGKEKKTKGIVSVIAGLLLAVPMLLVVVPLLSNVDMRFEAIIWKITHNIADYFSFLTIFYWILAIPIACYLFGLLYGGLHRQKPTEEELHKTASQFRVIPNITINTALIVLSLVYVLFLTLHGENMFSAFIGKTYGDLSFAQYAREGFFELCRVAAFNVLILVFASVMSQNEWRENKILQRMSMILSGLTLVLIATAISKMFLYIGEKGLTPLRLFTSIFLFFLGVVFVLIIVRCYKQFSVARWSISIFAAGFALLCCINAGGIIARYNANRYLNNTIDDMGIDVLWDTGYDGMQAAEILLEYERDEDLIIYMRACKNGASYRQNSIEDRNLSAQRSLNFESGK